MRHLWSSEASSLLEGTVGTLGKLFSAPPASFGLSAEVWCSFPRLMVQVFEAVYNCFTISWQLPIFALHSSTPGKEGEWVSDQMWSGPCFILMLCQAARRKFPEHTVLQWELGWLREAGSSCSLKQLIFSTGAAEFGGGEKWRKLFNLAMNTTH